MKNQQIHQQEKKISDLEKVVGSNKLSPYTRTHDSNAQWIKHYAVVVLYF